MGEQADDIFISFELTTEEEKNYEEVKEKFFKPLHRKKKCYLRTSEIHIRESSERVNLWIDLSQTCMASQDTAISERLKTN